MDPKQVYVVAAAFLLFWGSAGSIPADENHYVNNLIGDRASGFGGAYTAVADDVAGLYYNPAGIMYSVGKNISGSVNAFSNFSKKYDAVIGGNGWERRSTTLLPNFFGVVQPLGTMRVGISYAVPDALTEDQDETFLGVPSKFPGITATVYRINFNNDDRTVLFGPSLAYEVTDSMALGFTVYLHHRTTQSALTQLIYLSNGNTELTDQSYELHEQGYRPLIGIMWAPMEKLSIGLSAAKTLVSSADVATQTIFKGTTYPADQIDLIDTSTSEKRSYPLQVRAGAAYFPSSRLLVSADAIYSAAVTDEHYGNRVAVLNAAVGAEYYLDKSWAVRGGVYTDMANTPELSPYKVNQSERIDLTGVSLSFSNFTRNTSVTLGGTMTWGDGEAQVLRDTSTIQTVKVQNWTIYLSSSYAY